MRHKANFRNRALHKPTSSPGRLAAKFVRLWRSDGAMAAFESIWQFLGRKSVALLFSPLFTSPGRISLIRRLSAVKGGGRARAIELLGDTFRHVHSAEGQFEITRGGDIRLAGMEAVFLAHWDPQGKVDEYVARLGQHFKSLGKTVVLCTPCNPDASDSALDFADAIVRRRCQGSDFTSWKCGAAAFPDILAAKEITFCDDSSFGPMGSLAPVYEAMDDVDCDFWGLVPAKDGMPYLERHFLVFRAVALQNPTFAKFLDAIPASADPGDARALELRLGLWLELAGLRPGVFARFPLFGAFSLSSTLWWELAKYGYPLLGRELLSEPGRGGTMTNAWYDAFASSGYPVELILRYFYRNGMDISSAPCHGRLGDTCPPNIMARQIPVTLPAAETKEADLGVILHCYYEKGFALLAPYLANLPRSSILYISTDTEQKADFLRSEAKALDFTGLEVRVCPNAGWDMGPFLAGFADAIRRHDLILKAHVKMSSNQEQDFANAWRDLLYSSLMGSKSHVGRILTLFRQNAGLGILAPPTFQAIADVSQKNNARKLGKILAHFGIRLSPKDAIDFPVGGMFWARSKGLAPLLDIGLGFDDFEMTNPAIRDGTLAHAVERSFFFSCHAANLDWGRVPPPPYTTLAPVPARAAGGQNAWQGN